MTASADTARAAFRRAAIRSQELERAVEQGFVNHLIGRTRMHEALDGASGRAGTGQLKRLLAGLLPQQVVVETDGRGRIRAARSAP